MDKVKLQNNQAEKGLKINKDTSLLSLFTKYDDSPLIDIWERRWLIKANLLVVNPTKNRAV